jgi:hypothetical protein
MISRGNCPSRKEAEALLLWAYNENPGFWFEHSKVTARAAETIARGCSMDGDTAYILGLLHDIGRYAGIIGLRHVYSGHRLMSEKGFPLAARICLTHSFPYKEVDSYQGIFDCTQEERLYVYTELKKSEYDDFDRLIQLSDCLSLAQGVCLLEIRLGDVVKRSGITKYLQHKWNAFFELKAYFDKKCDLNIYNLFYDEILKTSFL